MSLRKQSVILITFIVTTFYGLALSAAECSAKSGKNRVALLELYTSEGCSSCPPADKWLSSLAEQGIGSDKVLPLSLHVDYWNYIGWRDPYSAAEYTQRQRKVAQRNRLRSIYTPQFVFNGRDYRGWRRQNVKLLLDEVNAWPAAAKLSLNWKMMSADTLTTSVSSELLNGSASGSTLFVALYENDLLSNVTAGENDGRSLHHDYVVRKMFAIPFSGKKTIDKEINFPVQPGWNKKNLGVATFVQQHRDGGILQALSAPIECKS